MAKLSADEAIKIMGDAIDKFGAHAQLDLLEEECIELALAIHKHRTRNIPKRDLAFWDVLDEIADVSICIDTFKMIFGGDAIEARRNFKLARLKKRIEKNQP